MPLLIDWNSRDFAALEQGVLVAQHALAATGLFSDEGLAQILDRQPDSALTLSTMGRDSHTFQWRDGDRNGVSGTQLVETVKKGHLWINCRDVLRHQPELARLVHQVYDELEAGRPGFRGGPHREPFDLVAQRDRALPRRHAGQHVMAFAGTETGMGLPSLRRTFRERSGA